MRPDEVVAALDKHIVGQADAKMGVAIAVRDQWRRQQLTEDLQQEVLPNNILMVGPTGVGKTEVARRLAKLVDAPRNSLGGKQNIDIGAICRPGGFERPAAHPWSWVTNVTRNRRVCRGASIMLVR